MKKQTTHGGKKLWLLLGIAAVLVLAVSGVLVLLGTGSEPEAETAYDGLIYWNIDRAEYLKPGTVDTIHATCRGKRDGAYVVRMAVNGEQMDVKTEDALVVQQMDNWDLMGLVFDEKGYVTQVVKPDELPGSVLQDVYVRAIDGDTVTVNTSPYYSGLERQITVTDQAAVYNVSNYDGSGLLTGMAGQLSLDDKISVVFDENGNATHVFSEPYWVPGDIYYNTVRYYDSVSGLSTRQSDVLGYYNFEFILDGQLVTARTKDLNLATEIDKQGYYWVGLEFDENGDISAVTSGGKAAHGKGSSMNTTVRQIKQTEYGLRLITMSAATGASGQAILHPDCQIYDFSGESEYGQTTQLREGDYIRCIQDHRGRIVFVAVVYRPGVSQYAYILDRQYDSEKRQTGRTPDADGWYYIKASVGGETVTLRCNDKNTVDYLDAQGTNILGVRLEGDVIKGYTPAAYTLAGYYLASGWDVTALDLEAGTISVTSMSGDSKGTVKSATLSKSCVVYNVSVMADTVGQTDQVQLGDTVRAYTNYKGEVEAIYVTRRPMNSSVYRKLQYLGKQADGYHHYLMAVDGKQVQVKAKAADVVAQMNKSKTLGLLMNKNNVVYKAVSAVETAGSNGGVFAQDGTYIGISDGVLQASKEGKTLEAPLAEGYQVYDLFSSPDKLGRKTSLRAGDVIQCFKNRDGQVTLVYVLKRETHNGGSHCLCYGAEHITNHSACKKLGWTKLTGAKDYKLTITKSGNYYLTSDLSAAVTVEKGVSVNLCLNGFTLQARQAITVMEGATLNLSDCTGEGRVASTHETNGGYAVKVNGGTVNFYSGTLTGIQPNNAERKNRCVLIAAGAFNMYGGRIRDGYLIDSKNGGNVLVLGGSFTMLGGEITGGSVTKGKGQDVYVADGGTMTLGGKARAGKVCLAAEGTLNFHESLNTAKASASVGLSDLTARFGVGTAQKTYALVITSLDENYTVRYDEEQKALYLKSNIAHEHCLCVGSEHIADHSACETLEWEPIPAVKDNKLTITKSGNYHLTQNVAGAMTIEKGISVNLCLNGYLLQARQAITVMEGATLNISDCTGKGVVASTHETNGGYAVKVDGGTVNFYSGTLTGVQPTNTERRNRCVLLASGQFNMYGGKIMDGYVKDSKNGGNVLVQSGSMSLLGGCITGGSVTRGKGADIYVSDGAVITLGGSAQAGQVTLASTGVMNFHESFDADTAGAVIDLVNKSTHVGIGTARESYLKAVTSFSQDYETAFDETQQSLYLKALGHRHCVCVGSTHVDDHGLCETVLWEPAPAVENYKITITQSGHYYLTQSQAATLVIEGDLTVELCLNGYKLSGGTPVTVGEGATLNICDHTGIGWIFSTKTDSTGYAVKVDGGTVNLYSGVLSGKHAQKEAYNRPLYMASGEFNMYGGAIRNGKAKTNEHGGNVYMGGGSFTMYGGTIENGYTNKHGGNICIQDGTFTMLGGSITGGLAGEKGGNVILLPDKAAKTAKFILEGGTIEGGLTEEGQVNAKNGGNICVNAVAGNAVFTVYGGSVTGGKVSQKGGNVFVYKSEGSVIELAAGVELTEVYLDTGKQITTIEPKEQEDAQ